MFVLWESACWGKFKQGIDRLFDFIEGFRLCFKDFREIGILFDPVDKSSCNKTEIPVPFNLFNVPDLIVIKVEGIF